MIRKKRNSKPSTSSEVEYTYSIRDYPNKGLIPLMMDLVDLLPDEMKPSGKRIVGVLTWSILAILSIFIIGVFVASFTGHSDQILNIFTASIVGVGVVSVTKIARTTDALIQ